MPPRKRVLLIGLDGFTWRLGSYFMANGIMPNLKRLVDEGCHGTLQSVIPFETSPAWSSFQTGCYPGKTGIFAFHGYDRQANRIFLNSFSDNRMPSLWELADRVDKTVVSINMPVSSPPPTVKGVIIPGLLCPKLGPETVHPASAYDKYIRHRKDYSIVNKSYQEDIYQYAQQAIATERVRYEVSHDLMADVDWDIFCVQMQSVDAFQHVAWPVLEPCAKLSHPKQHAEAVAFYQACDDIMNKMIKCAGEGTLTFIISDHGFCQGGTAVALNVWLRQRGYLNLHPEKSHDWWMQLKSRIASLKYIAKQYGRVWSKFKKSTSDKLFCETILAHLSKAIDFERTQAFCLGGMGGLIYIVGPPDKRHSLARQISEELLEEFGPESRQPVIKHIYLGQEIYKSPDPLVSVPDLVVEYIEGCESRMNPHGHEVVSQKGSCGTHDQNGIVVVNGPGIKKNGVVNGDIVDIVPTVLSYLQVPVPKHLDGKVLSEILSESCEIQYEDVAMKNPANNVYTNEEQAQVEQQLSNLGYL